jgi:hypothetical protein
MFLVTMLHPIFVMGIVVILATLIEIFGSASRSIPGLDSFASARFPSSYKLAL